MGRHNTLAAKSVQGCTLLARQRSRYAVYLQKDYGSGLYRSP